MNRLYDRKVLWCYLTGTGHHSKKEKRPFVVSEAIIDAVDMPDGLTAVYVGDHLPRDKADSAKLYEVRHIGDTHSEQSAV